ncbi:hypothetical protein GGR20_002153 [Devosia subaequoris]|uniref:Uncharacterized protein n=1 Tax=Devosia subaequoris TaxID=395930 RepID=A0A7W6INX9_9HYPH|nr:hypothetical protein [Devosia subaequoris]
MTSPSGEVLVVQNCNALQRPFGVIEATAHRGTMMGNRGDLRGEDGSLRRQWQTKRWICCTLHSKKGTNVTFDRPGRYYPLFFTDEAVALSAGHRPCAQCRRHDYEQFRTAWAAAHHSAILPTAEEIDAKIHVARLERLGQFMEAASALPSGTFVSRMQFPQEPILIWQGRAMRWTFGGYGKTEPIPDDEVVIVLTPEPIVRVLSLGYPISCPSFLTNDLL